MKLDHRSYFRVFGALSAALLVAYQSHAQPASYPTVTDDRLEHPDVPRELLRDLRPHERLERLVLQLGDERLEEALDDHAHRRGPVQPAGLHVEDRRLVELADRAAVRCRDVVGRDEHRGDRVGQHLAECDPQPAGDQADGEGARYPATIAAVVGISNGLVESYMVRVMRRSPAACLGR